MKAQADHIVAIVKAADELMEAIRTATGDKHLGDWWYGAPQGAPELPWSGRVIAELAHHLPELTRLGEDEMTCEEYGIDEDMRDDLWHIANK